MGARCPKCKRPCLIKTENGGRRCTNSSCGYEVVLPANGGKGGKGRRCVVCGKYKVFNGHCRNCGAYEKN